MSSPALEREIIECPACHLKQFGTLSGRCRRCHVELKPEPEPAPPLSLEAAAPPPPPSPVAYGALGFGLTVRALRLRRSWSQADLAIHANCPRTYISKIERGHAMPTMKTFERFAEVFEMELWHLARVWEFMEQGK